ncbi:hypothetical protein DAPPUDRAFT_116797 [Daphnia pulex]|uniref:Uncharacterized protein n=1 Tax=Daphnia pulex TaxID=6669 RepID=E9HQJ3_DAPPU|nr:hypothetical protein DAPPUDRAFT_116797 [Daphnia pulex]|eukprot:EFX65991.1 hypothetical protein DAPPUDRAFT_116797 [Daphnia pulex]
MVVNWNVTWSDFSDCKGCILKAYRYTYKYCGGVLMTLSWHQPNEYVPKWTNENNISAGQLEETSLPDKEVMMVEDTEIPNQNLEVENSVGQLEENPFSDDEINNASIRGCVRRRLVSYSDEEDNLETATDNMGVSVKSQRPLPDDISVSKVTKITASDNGKPKVKSEEEEYGDEDKTEKYTVKVIEDRLEEMKKGKIGFYPYNVASDLEGYLQRV